jgi:hypothetical protein
MFNIKINRREYFKYILSEKAPIIIITEFLPANFDLKKKKRILGIPQDSQYG